MMSKLAKWRSIVVGLLVPLGMLALVGTTLATSAGPPMSAGPLPLPIKSATEASLAIQGVSLHAPAVAAAAATVKQASAVSNALNQFHGSTLREVVLADVTDTNTQPNIHCTCWVVSLFPSPAMDSGSGGPPGSVRSPTSYLIVFYDSTSGAFVEGIQSGTGG
jgi:hypothetical protein